MARKPYTPCVVFLNSVISDIHLTFPGSIFYGPTGTFSFLKGKASFTMWMPESAQRFAKWVEGGSRARKKNRGDFEVPGRASICATARADALVEAGGELAFSQLPELFSWEDRAGRPGLGPGSGSLWLGGFLCAELCQAGVHYAGLRDHSLSTSSGEAGRVQRLAGVWGQKGPGPYGLLVVLKLRIGRCGRPLQ